MAMQSIPAPRPSIDELDRYLVTHTATQAARRWNVNERTIRKWRTRAHAPTASQQPQDARNTPDAVDTTVYAPTADDVAGDGTMWKCPWLGELMPIPPGAHRKAWEVERIAARERHKAAIEAVQTAAPVEEANLTEGDATAVVDSLQAAPAPTSGPMPDEALECATDPVPARPMMHDSLAARPPALAPQPRYITTRPEPSRSHLLVWPSGFDVEQLAHPYVALILAAILILLVYA